MENIKLTLNENTGKILSYETTTENGLLCIPDGYAAVIDSAKEQGFEVYFKNGRIVKRGKNEPIYEEEIQKVKSELNEIENESKSRLAAFINKKSEKTVFDMKEIMERRSQKIQEQKSLNEDFAEGIKNRMFALLNNNPFKYYCSICLIIRDESEYLKEWLEWHIGQGIQHFYIYDHGSKQPVSEFIKTLDKEIQDKVTVTYFGGKHVFAQHDAYNDCLEKYKYESRWIGFIDSDEMVRIKNGKKMPEYLKSFELYAGLFIAWEMYSRHSLPLVLCYWVRSYSFRPMFGTGKRFAISENP